MKTLADIQNELSGIYQQIADSGDCPAHLREDIEKKAKKQIAFLKKCEIALSGPNWSTENYILSEIELAKKNIEYFNSGFDLWKKCGNAPKNVDPKKLYAIWQKMNNVNRFKDRLKILTYILD